VTAPCRCDHDRLHNMCRTHGEVLRWSTPDGVLRCDCPQPVSDVLREIQAERARQDVKWGEQNHLDGTGLALPQQWRGASVLARKLCQLAARMGTCTWRHLLFEEVTEAFDAETVEELRAELVQVAAVATQWVEAIDRRSI